MSFQSDGQRLATCSIGQEPIKLWDTTSWEETANLEIPGEVLYVIAFINEDRTLAATDNGNRVFLWHAPAWEEIAAAEAKERPW